MKRVAVAAIVMLAFVPLSRPLAAQKGLIIQKVIVRVNGEIFTQTELEFQQIQALKQDNRTVANANSLQDAELAAALAPITPKILVAAVDELLMVQHGKEIPGVKFTEENYKIALDQLKKGNNIKDDAQFQQALKAEGITLAQLHVNIERAFFIQVVRQHDLAKSMNLTEEETRQYYNAHLNEFMKPATVTVREIFVNVKSVMVNGQASISVGDEEEAKAKITAARERALKGEDFAKLVTEFSDSANKSSGGLMGPVEENNLNPVIATAIEKLKPGDISEPLRRAGGYQLLKLETRIAPEPESLEKSKDAIAEKILMSRQDVEQEKLVQKLLTQAVIEWKDDTYKKMYEAERAARAKATTIGKAGH